MHYGFSLSLSGITASFREPGAHLYQTTLPLPPISALAGIAGAALGKTFKETWSFLKERGFATGVSGKAQGTGIDLWKYQKMATPKSADEKEAAKALERSKIVRSDILNREFLIHPHFEIHYAFPEKGDAERLRSAFLNPCYALSLGNSDDISMIKNVSELKIAQDKELPSLKDTILEGDHSANVKFDWGAVKKESVSQSLKLPLVRRLIVDFGFEEDARCGIRYCPFTFLLGFQCLLDSVKALALEDSSVPLFSI